MIVDGDTMRLIEKTAITKGYTDEKTLMVNASSGLFRVLCQQYSDCSEYIILCGPGNNGGDGVIAAVMLLDAGFKVNVLVYGEEFSEDLRFALKQYNRKTSALNLATFSNIIKNLDKKAVILDALFGIGLSRVIDGELADIISLLNASDVRVVSVDIPTGIDALDASVKGVAVRADLTVTFHVKKNGHVLLPGKEYTGRCVVCDIGINYDDVNVIGVYENDPALWYSYLKKISMTDNKYTRGHVAVVGGPVHCTGAARMASLAAAHGGCGMVTVWCDDASLPVYAASLTSVMIEPAVKGGFGDFVHRRKVNAVVIGPGCDPDDNLRELTLEILSLGVPCVIDAGAITAFVDNVDLLIHALHDKAVLTPHMGEFTRLFGDISARNKIELAARVAKLSGAVVLLKGSDTVIASAEGLATVNCNTDNGLLATAGSGDVLAGIIAGFAAGGAPMYQAARAGAFTHGECATLMKHAMTAEAIIPHIPAVIAAYGDA